MGNIIHISYNDVCKGVGLLKAYLLLLLGLLVVSSGLATSNLSQANLTNVSSSLDTYIAQGLIGSNDTYGNMIIGLILIAVVIIAGFTSRIGLMGATVIIAPLIILMANSGYLPTTLAVLIYIVMGIVWGAIIIKGLGVR